MSKKKLPDIIVSELFLIKADWNRCYLGEIRRENDGNGKEIVLGVVTVNEGRIWSKATSQEELIKNMDGICVMKLDKDLHAVTRRIVILFDTDFFLN